MVDEYASYRFASFAREHENKKLIHIYLYIYIFYFLDNFIINIYVIKLISSCLQQKRNSGGRGAGILTT